ncbi:MAG: amidohydrolase family protein [bacterium]|nr:amidohydrolase family protein [bacterium]
MILIKGAKILDGSGKQPVFTDDVLLKGNKIAAIGKFPNRKTQLTVEAMGLYLAPGFIDVDTDSDHHLSLFTNPAQQDFLLQGVTTIFGGVCGASLAPLLAGNLDSIRKWTDTTQINIDWHTMAEFLKVLGRRGLGVNFGTLVGHSTIRRGLIREDARDLTVPEIAALKKVLKDAIKEGAFGLSTGLSSAHSKRVPYSEIKELVGVVAQSGGVYATHLRDERDGLLASVDETIKMAQETGAKVLISHFKPIQGFEKDYRKAVELIHRVADSVNIHFDSYPFGESIVPIYTLLPAWAQVGNLEVMLNYLKNPDLASRLIKEFAAIRGGDIRIAQAVGQDYLVGKTLNEFAENQQLNTGAALVKLMKLTNLRALVFYRNINLDLLTQSMEREQGLIASNGASLPADARILKHERFTNTFPKFLELTIQQKTLSLPQAIAKITSEPAEKFGLKNRGLIAEGRVADIVMFSARKGVKVENVFVNGQLAVKDREYQGILSGEILRKN